MPAIPMGKSFTWEYEPRDFSRKELEEVIKNSQRDSTFSASTGSTTSLGMNREAPYAMPRENAFQAKEMSNKWRRQRASTISSTNTSSLNFADYPVIKHKILCAWVRLMEGKPI